MDLSKIKRVIIEEGADRYAQTFNILSKFDGQDCEIIRHPDERVEYPVNSSQMDKGTLRLIEFKGEFLKPCPGTKEYICCGYQILNVGTNCPMNCSYCILQAYFNKPSLRLFINIEENLERICEIIDNNPEKTFRIGTGEFTDSLAIDPIADWTGYLPKYFSKRKNAVLEFKTKTDCINGLLKSQYRDRIIVSWSLNSRCIASKEEHGAPSISKRLKCARICQEEGYVLAFHFDPLIFHDRWKEEYARTLDLLDKYIDPKKIIWVSMGCLRFMPRFKDIFKNRHPESKIIYNEFIPGLDGKMRYFKPLRIEMYSFMREKISEFYEDIGLYLCMESDSIWKDSMKWSPGDSRGLAEFLDKRVEFFFN
ncbi:MAG: DNA photolyase [Deltaproteobacteria bacterium]|nr:DNA photolyase [Deltaproteobacteria bacterium]